MKKYTYIISPLFLFFFLTNISLAQTTFIDENFDSCTFPSDWTVNLIGNQNPEWFVGLPTNTNSDGNSIDGSCMVVIDDDLTGDNTPFYTAQFISPTFDATIHSTINFSVDVSFRQYEESAFKVKVFDGTAYQDIRTFQYGPSQTGVNFSEFVTVTADLSFYANPNMNVMLEYDDGDTWAWYAGFDNVLITGEGNATNLVMENFNSCALPAGWTISHSSGVDDWQFGDTPNPNASDSTMNSTCMLYFDDDYLGENAAPSNALIMSPFFDGTAYGNYFLDFDFIFRTFQNNESIGIYVTDGTNNELVQVYSSDVGGPQFTDFVHQTIDLSAYRSPNMAIAFEYSDGGTWGWWAGIDDFKVSGSGSLNDFCSDAVPLVLDGNCEAANNTNALFTEEAPNCNTDGNVASLWYSFAPTNNGWVAFETDATFNDLITVFTGSCIGLTQQVCSNKDEHGFRGERLLLNAVAGTDYYVRVSGLEAKFGIPKGDLCMSVVSANAPDAAPVNDNCGNAISLVVDGTCINGDNYNATESGFVSSRNPYARHDVWYNFNATQTDMTVATNANFADVITVFEGNCGNLTEFMTNEIGCELQLENLTIGNTYFVQVAGVFSTVSGDLCMELRSTNPAAPPNDDCLNAALVNVGGNCVNGSIDYATVDGIEPTCEIFEGGNIWYRFVAPSSGGVRMNVNADFEHSVAVYEGSACGNLSEMYCGKNPVQCDGLQSVLGLVPSDTYYLQITTPENLSNTVNGDFCLELIDFATPYMETPLSVGVQVNCTGIGSAQLSILVSGGSGNYTMQGDGSAATFNSGYEYVVVATDNVTGCQQSAIGIVDCGVSDCLPTITLTGTETTTAIYQTSDRIISDQIIEATADLEYDAANCIELNPGFETQLGAIFHAKIDGCTTSSVGGEHVNE